MDEDVTAVERELEKIQLLGAPATLRARVLDKVHRELATARWERRIARTAAALFVGGVALNLAVNWRDGRAGNPRFIASNSADAIVEVAAAVAEVTDAETGRIVALNLAALSGATLSDRQVADIQAASRPSPAAPAAGKDG